MGMPSMQEAVWKVMTACAANRQDGKCKHEWGDDACNQCELYAYHYVDTDDRKIRLLMLQAESDMSSLKHAISRAKVFTSIAASLLMLLVAGVVVSLFIVFGPEPKTKTKVPTAVVEQQHSTVVNDIETTLYKVAIDYSKNKDVNKDGLVNCIDAAVLFYKYFPDKRLVRIYLNYNTAKDFNHLFNLVNVNGTWIGVEPQAKLSNDKDWRMYNFWGSKYDYHYNEDATETYSKFAR